jgi:hypothetical protein
MFRDINGKISRKAVAAYILVLNGVALVWYATIKDVTGALPYIITLISAGTGLMTATLGEKKNVEPTANTQ